MRVSWTDNALPHADASGTLLAYRVHSGSERDGQYQMVWLLKPVDVVRRPGPPRITAVGGDTRTMLLGAKPTRHAQ